MYTVNLKQVLSIWSLSLGNVTAYSHSLLGANLIMFFFVFLSMPADALDLFDSMLTLDPSKRITAEESLEHAFLKDIVCENISPPR